MLALRAEHVAIDDQRLLVTEQVGQAHRAVLSFEAIIARHLAARRQLPPLFRHSLDVAPQLDFPGQKGIARPPVVFAFVGESGAVLLHQLCRRREWFRRCHDRAPYLSSTTRSIVGTSGRKAARHASSPLILETLPVQLPTSSISSRISSGVAPAFVAACM